ncbi:Protein SlyX [invertebrate metagenome]|uniref:Protein SlyX n=1 Tax=invertebrate metagenome TaxID=1711999 RepID=A0A2H9T428_9ZZZZ
MNAELVDLQTQLSFQEDTIDQLNNVVTRQEKDIERLFLEIEQLRSQVKALSEGDGIRDSRDEVPPPHY